MLEQSVILAEISRKLTLDEKEWERLNGCRETIETVVLARVASICSMLFPMFIDVISISHAIRFRIQKFLLNGRIPWRVRIQYDKSCNA